MSESSACAVSLTSLNQMDDNELLEKRRKRNERAMRYRDKTNPDRNRKRRSDSYAGEIGIICSRCCRDLPFSSYPVDKRYTLGYNTTCWECHTLRQYGITVLDYYAMYEEQAGRCRLCGLERTGSRPDRRPLDVDHNHTTGKVRGLLCGPCNRGLGFFGDSIEGLQRAIDYLKEWEYVHGG